MARVPAPIWKGDFWICRSHLSSVRLPANLDHCWYSECTSVRPEKPAFEAVPTSAQEAPTRAPEPVRASVPVPVTPQPPQPVQTVLGAVIEPPRIKVTTELRGRTVNVGYLDDFAFYGKKIPDDIVTLEPAKAEGFKPAKAEGVKGTASNFKLYEDNLRKALDEPKPPKTAPPPKGAAVPQVPAVLPLCPEKDKKRGATLVMYCASCGVLVWRRPTDKGKQVRCSDCHRPKDPAAP